ncbi:uncharacterized protein LOC142317317 isoform X3 [Lycorma delicatula]|uniref:uncharacterized protein LOC142317317 isoform X3 n=1 Tax=Lycorma delicatula TaxID=130591 RepID=UPI003F51A3F9
MYWPVGKCMFSINKFSAVSMSSKDSDQFSLRWDNFSFNMKTEFHSLLESEDLVDVTLATDGHFIQAHKIVLSACSPYFKSLFKVNPCKHPIIILKGIQFEELKKLLQFIYRGEVNVNQKDLPEFLKTAELLQVKGLVVNDSEKANFTSKNEVTSAELKQVWCDNDEDNELPVWQSKIKVSSCSEYVSCGKFPESSASVSNKLSGHTNTPLQAFKNCNEIQIDSINDASSIDCADSTCYYSNVSDEVKPTQEVLDMFQANMETHSSFAFKDGVENNVQCSEIKIESPSKLGDYLDSDSGRPEMLLRLTDRQLLCILEGNICDLELTDDEEISKVFWKISFHYHF